MKPLLVALVTTLLGGATATAQVVSQPQRSSGATGMENSQTAATNAIQLLAQPAPINSCPVSMRAQHLSDGSLIETSNGHPSEIGQRLHLSLASRDSKQIARATLRVRGFSPKARVTETRFGGDQAYDATQTLTVVFAPTTGRSAAADFRVPDMTAVGSIDVEALEYSDGSTWEAGAASSCRVIPDPEMLITSR